MCLTFIRQIPKKSVADSAELPCNEPQNAHAVSAERPCSVRRASVLCPQNIRALSADSPSSVHRPSEHCPQIVRALSAERQCSVCAVCASVYYVSVCPQNDLLATSPIVVTRMPMIPKTLVAQFHVDRKWCENHHQGQK